MSTYQCHYVYCADIGSVKKNKFGWAGVSICPNGQQAQWREDKDMWKLVDDVADKLKKGANVALGFECPTWVPIRDCPEELTSARRGEVIGGLSRPWSAGAGLGSLGTGLTQIPWILEKIRVKSPEEAKAFLDWDSYQKSEGSLFIWEAFVSGGAKSGSDTKDQDIGDARVAVSAFVKALPSLRTPDTVCPGLQTRSLIGAALLWAGWSKDIGLLHKPCKVIKAYKNQTT